MAADSEHGASAPKRIIVRPNGSYRVEGNIPLVHKTQVVSEYGEPLTWKKDGTYETRETYTLCRCGASEKMPFCDAKHKEINFDGTETADTRPTAERQVIFEGGTRIVVKYDKYLCMESGYCANRLTNIEKMTPNSGDPQVRAQIMTMIDHCPSGSYAYSLEEGSPDIEADLPQQIAVTTEITSGGPIEGPLWVTGNIPVERADGQPFETRNRVTLCSCGLSCNKPLCDGTHRRVQEEQQQK
jgi:CDGSH-type Zn-finger protein